MTVLLEILAIGLGISVYTTIAIGVGLALAKVFDEDVNDNPIIILGGMFWPFALWVTVPFWVIWHVLPARKKRRVESKTAEVREALRLDETEKAPEDPGEEDHIDFLIDKLRRLSRP